MPFFENIGFDLAPFWAWILLFARLTGLFTTLPGIGTDQVPPSLRFLTILGITSALSLGGARAEEPGSLVVAALAVSSEYLLGYLLGTIPALVLDAVAVSGQTVAAAIGLAHANTIDPSIGQGVTVLTRIQTLFATLVFLELGGHRDLIRLALVPLGKISFYLFTPSADTAMLLSRELSQAFDLALSLSAPILATTLITQFALGLLTKFVPQLNIFIVSMPLSLLVGLFIITFSLADMTVELEQAYERAETTAFDIFGNVAQAP